MESPTRKEKEMPDNPQAKVKKAALVPFGSLEVGDWFVFPEAIERLVNSDEFSDNDRCLAFKIKTNDRRFVGAEQVHEGLTHNCEGNKLVVGLVKPMFILVG